MRRFDAVLFDAGETLLHPDPSFPELIVDLLRGRGLRVDPAGLAGRLEGALPRVFRAMDTLLAEGKQFSTSPEVSRAFWTGLYERVLDELGIRDEDGAHATYLYDEFSKPERYALFPDALPALRELTAHGYVLGIVSNFEGWLGGLLDRLGIAGLMKVVVVSGVEGIEKPDPRIFRLAMDRLGLAASRVVYVGDNPRIDLEPAVALGMGTVLLDRRGIHDGFRGTVVRSLEQVPAAIR